MENRKYPFYIKSVFVLLGLTLLVFALSGLREIMVPLAFALMLAILLNPMVNRLENKKLNRVLAISISLFLAFAIIAGIVFFLYSQVLNFGDEWPALKKRSTELIAQLQKLLSGEMGIPIKKQNQLLTEAQNNLKPVIGSALGSVLESLSIFFLLPVYCFLFLYYKKLILDFLYEIFAEKRTKEVAEVLQQTKGAIQSYMIGLLLEALIVAAMNSVALLLIGVKYAILIGVLGAILNILPYIGGIIAIALPVIIATITKDGFQTQFLIIGAYLLIQFIDNNFLVPMIVSSKVRINALISIIAVLLGGALWGVAGMFLSIPFVGVLKIIFDNVPEVKPWGKLLGDEIPTRHRGEQAMRKAKAVTENVVKE